MNRISIVIPIFNESENIINLINEIKKNLQKNFIYEIIVVDDYSNDNSYNKIKQTFNDVLVIRNKKNMGQSFSIYTGVKKASYSNIVTIDGDGQNPPDDINKLAKMYFTYKYNLVGGLRLKRRDSFIKKISSKVANNIRTFFLKDNCLDTGCSLKIFDKEFFLLIPFFKGMHRFLPALFQAYGAKTHFIEVGHRPRTKGKSKYGTIDRLIIGTKDLIKVLYLIKRIKK